MVALPVWEHVDVKDTLTGFDEEAPVTVKFKLVDSYAANDGFTAEAAFKVTFNAETEKATLVVNVVLTPGTSTDAVTNAPPAADELPGTTVVEASPDALVTTEFGLAVAMVGEMVNVTNAPTTGFPLPSRTNAVTVPGDDELICALETDKTTDALELDDTLLEPESDVLVVVGSKTEVPALGPPPPQPIKKTAETILIADNLVFIINLRRAPAAIISKHPFPKRP